MGTYESYEYGQRKNKSNVTPRRKMPSNHALPSTCNGGQTCLQQPKPDRHIPAWNPRLTADSRGTRVVQRHPNLEAYSHTVGHRHAEASGERSFAASVAEFYHINIQACRLTPLELRPKTHVSSIVCDGLFSKLLSNHVDSCYILVTVGRLPSISISLNAPMAQQDASGLDAGGPAACSRNRGSLAEDNCLGMFPPFTFTCFGCRKTVHPSTFN